MGEALQMPLQCVWLRQGNDIKDRGQVGTQIGTAVKNVAFQDQRGMGPKTGPSCHAICAALHPCHLRFVLQKMLATSHLQSANSGHLCRNCIILPTLFLLHQQACNFCCSGLTSQNVACMMLKAISEESNSVGLLCDYTTSSWTAVLINEMHVLQGCTPTVHHRGHRAAV